MSQSKTKTAAEDLMASLMDELNLSSENKSNHKESADYESEKSEVLSVVIHANDQDQAHMTTFLGPLASAESKDQDESGVHEVTELNRFVSDEEHILDVNFAKNSKSMFESTEVTEQNIAELSAIEEIVLHPKIEIASDLQFNDSSKLVGDNNVGSNDPTLALQPVDENAHFYGSDNEKTVPIAGYSNRPDLAPENNVKVSVGQSRGAFSSGYAAWGSSDSQLVQAENLRIAQEKILELEKDNEKLRLHNEELITASEIVKERAELLTTQVHEFKNDRDGLEQSFKSEIQLVKNRFQRKDNELQKALMKIDELDSRLKFDMKKIRIRERELENRLELVRAEKNALVKSKDEQILDLRRKMDQVQMEVESYRQKCVDLNKALDVNQDSFKRTTRALRLAMANLELQDENKVPLKKAE